MEDKDAELRLRLITAHSLPRSLDILLQLLDSVLERRTGIIHLVHDQHPLADQVLHLAKRRHDLISGKSEKRNFGPLL